MRPRHVAVVSLSLLGLTLGLLAWAAGPGAGAREPLCCTFSIVGHDPEKGEWGVAVASKYLAVGSAVPFAQAGAGALATQSFVNVKYGPDGLKLLAEGKSADEVVKELTEADPGRDRRQLGVVDRSGKSATFSGSKCLAWAGGKAGTNYAAQGNILTGPETVDEMAKSFEATKGPLAWRLMTALEAGQMAGGDKRGKQSAAILVVRERGGPSGVGDRFLDLRVDDHKEPIPELARILALRVRKPAEAGKDGDKKDKP